MAKKLPIIVGSVLMVCVVGRLHPFEASLEPPTKALPCSSPVKRNVVEFPENMIIGGPGSFKMYSGYVNVTDRDFLFYWLAEAEEAAPQDAPLIVWSNGGPGCSAMEGFTTEHGPYVLFDIKESVKGVGGRLSKNPYSWNKKAHVLYVDQPRYVGYSCGTGPYVSSSVDAGKDMVTFLRGWLELFPEHASRDIIIAAESYGGHYIPAWTGAILDYNAASSEKLPLTGIAIGNGIINETIQDDEMFIEFARQSGLLPKGAKPKNERAARKLMSETLGYSPNFYDYRLKDIEGCGCTSYNYSTWSHWLMRKDVIKSLNVCGNAGDKAFAGCNAGCVNLPPFDTHDKFDYSGALNRALKQGIKVTLYYGMQDTACNFIGGYAVASRLQWQGAEAFSKAPLKDLEFGGVTTGKVKSAAGLTWVQVEAAGHMVPINNPAAASFAINTLTKVRMNTGVTV